MRHHSGGSAATECVWDVSYKSSICVELHGFDRRSTNTPFIMIIYGINLQLGNYLSVTQRDFSPAKLFEHLKLQMVTFAVRWVRTASRGKVLGKSERQSPETWHDDIRCQPALSTQLLHDSVYCFYTRRKKLVTLMNPTFSGHGPIFLQSLSIISKNVKLQSTESVQPLHLHGGQVRL